MLWGVCMIWSFIHLFVLGFFPFLLFCFFSFFLFSFNTIMRVYCCPVKFNTNLTLMSIWLKTLHASYLDNTCSLAITHMKGFRRFRFWKVQIIRRYRGKHNFNIKCIPVHLFFLLWHRSLSGREAITMDSKNDQMLNVLKAKLFL